MSSSTGTAARTPGDVAAAACARDAFENHFPDRRGVWWLPDVKKFCVFNNNPYADDPARRDRETAEFRRWLAANGIPEVGYATYPPDGAEAAGYTYAMLPDAPAEREDDIVGELIRILRDG